MEARKSARSRWPRISRTLGIPSLGLLLTLAGGRANAQQGTSEPLPPPAVLTQAAPPVAAGMELSGPAVAGPVIPGFVPCVPGLDQPYVPTYAPPPDGPEGHAQPSFANHHLVKGTEEGALLSNVPIGLQPIPERPRLLVELNDKFLSPGFLSSGIELPTGEVVRPSLWVWGTNQAGYDYFDNRAATRNISEMPERLDLFTQLNLSGTERIFYAVRPFDKERLNKRQYSSIGFNPDYSPSRNGLNWDVESLFFEGDFGQISPNLDVYDRKRLDYGFSVGRQPLLLQEGLLVNANQLDAVTVTRNTLNRGPDLNTRATLMYAWDRIHRNNDVYDPTASLYGLFTETDFHKTTINANAIYVSASDPKTGSAWFLGASATQRLNVSDWVVNDTFHLLTSVPDHETAATGRGTLLFNEFSITPHRSPGLVYLTTFWAIDEFSSAARNPEVGGPLGQTGILFASPALGRFGAPLNNQATDVAGGALGWQIALDDTRKLLTLELGGRKDTNNVTQGQIGFGTRYQQAIGRHHVLIVDGFITKQEKLDPGTGARLIWLTKF